MSVTPRLKIVARCALAGLCLVAAVPPWGWWPLAFPGIALLDRLLAGQPRRARFARTWLVTACWLFPGTLWMLDLTAPGYVIAQALHAAMFGVLAIAVPPGRGRRLALPGAFVIAELWRWSWPFGGVPLATIPMGQADSPLAPTVRTLGSLLLVALVVAIGVGLSALFEREWRAVAAVVVVVALALGWAAVAPAGHTTRTIEAAVVQGGGKQRTRANPEDNPAVFQRHLDASAQIRTPVDLVLWPENVVNPRAPYLDHSPDPRFLDFDDAARRLRDLAIRLHTTLLPGWFYPVNDHETVNYTEVIASDGTVLDRYDKVRTVPFGEFVPLRWLIEPFAANVLPPRDVKPGTGPAVLDTPVGRVGVSISWEIFFDTRGRDAIGHGGTALMNPTNGSSYWLAILQTQQIASSKLRALETGRWVLQAAPTGFSAIIDAEGNVLQRTGISEQRVLQGSVELRDGRTIAVRVGHWPMEVIALALLAGAWLVARRSDQEPSHVDEEGDRPVVDELDEHVGAEASRGDGGAQLGQPPGDEVDQGFGVIGRSRGDP
jgi:apolipoprotein N-acyltransferase